MINLSAADFDKVAINSKEESQLYIEFPLSSHSLNEFSLKIFDYSKKQGKNSQ